MINGSRVLITGGSGLLGKALMKDVPYGYDVVGTYYVNTVAFCQYRADITDIDDVMRMFYVIKPTICIHTAAIGAVDYCEKHPEHAMKVNIDGTQNIIQACKQFGTKLVLMSTNAVFDGTRPPYTETDPVCSISVYGHTKVQAERMVQEELDNYLIVRTARLFGHKNYGGRDTWRDILYRAHIEGREMKIVTDDVANPTYATYLASAIWQMLDKELTGIYHAVGREACSMYQFAVDFAKVLGYNLRIRPITSDQLPSGIMVRPANTTLSTAKLSGVSIDIPDYLTAFGDMFKND